LPRSTTSPLDTVRRTFRSVRSRSTSDRLVGGPGQAGLALHHPYYPSYTNPGRWEGDPYLLGTRHCVECRTELLGIKDWTPTTL
jgi:hypothetical protein